MYWIQCQESPSNLRKDATIAARNIDVEVHEGLVTLKGVVGNCGREGSGGVTRVVNRLTVKRT